MADSNFDQERKLDSAADGDFEGVRSYVKEALNHHPEFHTDEPTDCWCKRGKVTSPPRISDS